MLSSVHSFQIKASSNHEVHESFVLFLQMTGLRQPNRRRAQLGKIAFSFFHNCNIIMIEWKKLMWFFFDIYLFLLPVGYHSTLLQQLLCGHSILGKVTVKNVA